MIFLARRSLRSGAEWEQNPGQGNIVHPDLALVKKNVFSMCTSNYN